MQEGPQSGQDPVGGRGVGLGGSGSLYLCPQASAGLLPLLEGFLSDNRRVWGCLGPLRSPGPRGQGFPHTCWAPPPTGCFSLTSAPKDEGHFPCLGLAVTNQQQPSFRHIPCRPGLPGPPCPHTHTGNMNTHTRKHIQTLTWKHIHRHTPCIWKYTHTLTWKRIRRNTHSCSQKHIHT